MTTRLLPTRDWTTRVLTASGLAALVLAGCSASQEGDDPEASNTPSDLSPLEEYMGEGALGFDAGGGGMAISIAGANESSEEQKKQEREVQDLIATCMEDQGFEYVPYVPDEDAGDEFEDAFALPADEFADKYGYGISTLMPVGPESDEGDSDDPNTAIAEALSADARAAYDKALWGANGGPGGTVIQAEPGTAEGPVENGPPTIAPEDKGCWMTAADEVFGMPEEGFDDGFTEFQGLFDDVSALQERIESDPRLTDAKAAWSDCMADAGFPDLAEPTDAEAEVSDRMSALWGDQGSDGGGAEIDPSNVDPEALAEVQEFELDIAPADYECQQDHVDLYEEVRNELESAFVEDHKAELEAYKEWSASNEGMTVGVG